MPRRLVCAALALAALALPATAAAADPLPTDGTLLIGAAASGSLAVLPTPVNQSSPGRKSVSQDGRYVAFVSDADGLSGEDDDRVQSVYVKDRVTGAAELVSRATGATGAPNDRLCDEPSISDDGQRVAFSCSGPLTPADTNDTTDVYVRDRASATTILVSTGSLGVGSSGSSEPAISGNGSYVAFGSFATNLVGNGPTTGEHVYRRLLGGANTIDLVDAAPSPAKPNGLARQPTISDDGSRVAFLSQSTNLVAGVIDTNNYPDVYYRQFPSTSTTGLVSAISGLPTTAANGAAGDPAISGLGGYVAFTSTATNSGTGDTDSTANVYRRALGSSTIVLIDRADGAAGAKATGYQYGPAISDDGDTVAFVSNATQLPAANGKRQVYVRHVGATTTELASRGDGDGPAVSQDSSAPSLSGDGAVVAFPAVGLTADADPFAQGVFARVLATSPASPKTTTLVSRPAGSDPFVNLGGSAQISGPGALSADGRYAVFSSAAPALPGQPATSVEEIWRRDTLTGEVVLVSRADGAAGAPADADASNATISANGNRVAFMTAAANFGLGVAASDTGVYVRDIAAGTTVLASRAEGAGGAVASHQRDPAISADGRRVAFGSPDAALGVSDGHVHLFVRDVPGAQTFAIAPTQDADANVPRLSADGGRVVWEAQTGSGGMGTERHVWLADVAGGAPSQIDAGAPDGFDASAPTISGDGGKIAFATAAALLPADTNGDTDVYVRDAATSALTLASVGAGGAIGDAGAYDNEISSDGTKVAFGSDATNLVPGDTDAATDVFVRDLVAGTTTLASRGDGASGAALEAGAGADALAITADAGCVAFQTQSTSLAPNLSPYVDRVWLRAVRGPCPVVPPTAPGDGGGPVPGPGPSPVPGPGPTAHAPVVRGFKAVPARFRTRGRKAGTTLRFRLDRAAKVRIVIARLAPGHRVGHRCRKGAPRKHQKRCVLRHAVVTLRRAGRAGTNSVRFSGKVKRHPLARGAYVATLTATAAGRRSKPVSVRLTVR